MEEQKQVLKFRCQRIGCDAMFNEEDNTEGSCRFHASPFFHDGTKEWSCCKKRSHDFSLFLEIPGCKTGRHTTEKPVLTKPTANPKKAAPVPAPTPSPDASSKEACPRCRLGFFCSGHGSQPNETKHVNATAAVSTGSTTDAKDNTLAPAKKIVDINELQLCKNKGCGKSFKEKNNHESACDYHPGPALFHDRTRGWNCCDIHVKEFDEFMSIPPCTKGWHNADPVS